LAEDLVSFNGKLLIVWNLGFLMNLKCAGSSCVQCKYDLERLLLIGFSSWNKLNWLFFILILLVSFLFNILRKGVSKSYNIKGNMLWYSKITWQRNELIFFALAGSVHEVPEQEVP
jgi:hypothetical protein